MDVLMRQEDEQERKQIQEQQQLRDARNIEELRLQAAGDVGGELS